MERRVFIISSLSALLAGCGGGKQLESYDLASPFDFKKGGRGRGQLTIAEPKAIAAYDTDRMVVRQGGGAIAYISDGVFADKLPRLVQTRILQAFESSNRLASVGRVGERLASDYQLLCDIRHFHLDVESGQAVKIEFAIKIMNDKTGRILAAEIFGGSVPVASASAKDVAQGFDIALKGTLEKVIPWAARII